MNTFEVLRPALKYCRAEQSVESNIQGSACGDEEGQQMSDRANKHYSSVGATSPLLFVRDRIENINEYGKDLDIVLVSVSLYTYTSLTYIYIPF